ncbi:MAG TPA: gfo/Idh/MocA family oxidoreductase, partial [Acetobacteraceae bacterium]
FERQAYGGIINDIGVHSIDQFLAFADTDEAEIVMSTVGAFGTAPDGFEDFAEIVMQTPSVRGYVRLDWFTPDGLPTWGDGRLFLIGTEGTLELRKNLDIEGRAGTDHMFIANRTTTRHVDCSALPVTYYSDFIADVRDRTQTAAPQSHMFTVSRMALTAQAEATRFTARARP